MREIDFATIATRRSFIRAAQRLRVAQAWLFARIHSLNRLSTIVFFDRTTRCAWLTDRGAYYSKLLVTLQNLRNRLPDGSGRTG
ncbi:helix-turn-helix domain-containing protein [Rhizorhabdus argentea]|uniref:helix-turn-helix domain-containing protein n=1 Tax=Rhizorhabdus argentea TaxID=1387174 RepID=UPI003BF51CA2